MQSFYTAESLRQPELQIVLPACMRDGRGQSAFSQIFLTLKNQLFHFLKFLFKGLNFHKVLLKSHCYHTAVARVGRVVFTNGLVKIFHGVVIIYNKKSDIREKFQ